MKITKTMGMIGKLADKLQLYSNYNPTPLSLKSFTAFGQAGVETKSFEFLRHELPTRLANIMREIHLLPDRLLQTPSAKAVMDLYEQSFDDIIGFDKNGSGSTVGSDVLADFTDTLDKIRERHANVVETMAQGIIEMKQQHGVDPLTDYQLQYFLDRFFISRISIRMLINQHVSLFGGNLNQNRSYVGCIDQGCNPLFVLTDAYGHAASLCRKHLFFAPKCRVRLLVSDAKRCSSDMDSAHLTLSPDQPHGPTTEQNSRHTQWMAAKLQLVYVPDHLFYIMFEVLKNAMRAVVEAKFLAEGSGSKADFLSRYTVVHRGQVEEALPPLEVLLVRGNEDVTVKVSDRGIGIAHRDLEEVFKYTYTTVTEKANAGVLPPTPTRNDLQGQQQSGNATVPNRVTPMAGYGYGLPLSRLYARYFQGDLRLCSVQGYGTDAHLYLKRSPAESGELLPIFNHTTAMRYENTVLPGGDWSKSASNSRRRFY